MEGEDALKVEMFTWGSFRRVYAEILYPERVDLTKLGGGHGEYVYDSEFFTITIHAHDSSKNMNREVTIKPKANVLVRVYGSLSASRKFDKVYVLRPGREPEAVDVTPKIVKTVDDKFEVTKEIGVANIGDHEVVVFERIVERRKLYYELKLKKDNNRVYISGDTYDVRDELKKLKFRFDPATRAWYIDNVSVEDVEVTLKNNIPNATIEIL